MGVNTKIKLLKKENLKVDVLKFTCLATDIAKRAKPGQFIEVKVSKTYEPFLKRPISIHNVSKEEGTIEFIFQIRGRGTEFLSQIEEGEMLEVVGPLGDSAFDYKKYKNIAIIGGGIGIFPLYELAKQAKEQANISVYLGFRNKDLVMLEEKFKNVSNKLVIATDDGTYGQAGYAIDFLKKDAEEQKFDAIFACGPLPMLKIVKEFAENNNIDCQISLEQRMGCGIGACMGCSVKLNTEDGSLAYARVCKDGPVFNSKEIDLI